MFWIKRFKHSGSEEVNIEKSRMIKEDNFELKIKDFDYITEAIVKALAYRRNPIIKGIIDVIKEDEETFKEFIKFIERNYNEYEMLQIILEKYKKPT